MAYTTPMLSKIHAFDATLPIPSEFINIEVGFTNLTTEYATIPATLKIYDNNTGTEIISGGQSVTLTMEGSYSQTITYYTFQIPSAFTSLLSNGNVYYATITVSNSGTDLVSNGVVFYCFTTPTITISTIPATIQQNTCKVSFTYSQNEGELLNVWWMELYNSNDVLISQSPNNYTDNYEYTFSSLSNDTTYYVKVVAHTIHELYPQATSSNFTVSYTQIEASSLINVTNYCDEGYIGVSASLVSTSININTIYSIKLKRGIKIIPDPLIPSQYYYDWNLTLGEKLVYSRGDSIGYDDYFVKSNQEYYYAAVLVDTAGNEGTYYISTGVTPLFNKVMITDGSSSYNLTNATTYSGHTRNQETGTYTTFGRQYPLMVMNGKVNYNSMTTSAYLIYDNTSGSIDRPLQTQYEKDFVDFMTNGKAKILKDFNNNIWLIALSGSPAIEPIQELGNTIANISFEWNEIGDAESEDDLKNAGLITQYVRG